MDPLPERDLADFRAIADLLARDIRGARKIVLPGFGHMPWRKSLFVAQRKRGAPQGRHKHSGGGRILTLNR
jgi:hypothetical protein